MDLEYEQALQSILSSVAPAPPEKLPLIKVHRRVLVEAVLSTVDLPGFDNSAVDGYAVRSADLQAATAQAPVSLRVLGRVAAGETWKGSVPSGCCVRLFTGSALPQGASAVVMQEDTRIDPANPNRIDFLTAAAPGEFVRRRGEDVRRGAILVRAGEVLTASRISLLAASGVAEVQVGCSPKVSILATGSELREAGAELRPGEIYESNRPGLAAQVSAVGGIPAVRPILADDLASTRAALENAFADSDAVVTSGGVSVGELDFVRRALTDIGGQLEFWRVAIKPGRPFAFGKVGTKFFFGLPGNPVSALVTFFLLVRPALLRWQGAAEVWPASFEGVLAEDLANSGNRRHFVRVRVDCSGKVYSTGLQGSHVLSALATANGLVDLKPGAAFKAGCRVTVFRLE